MLSQTFTRLLRRLRRHSIVGDALRLHEVIVRPVGEHASCLLPCVTDHLPVVFVDVAPRFRVVDCIADKLQMQYWVLCTGYITGTTLRNTKGVRLPATVS